MVRNLFLFLLISISSFGQSQLGWLQSQNYSTEYQAILDYATTQYTRYPSPDQRKYQNQLVKELVAAGIWSLTDCMKVMAVDAPIAFTDINWKNPGSNNSTRVKAPTFFRNDSFLFGGSTPQNYINTGWAPSTGTNYTLNSAEMIIAYKNISSGTFVDGIRDNSSGLNGLVLNPLSGSTQCIWEVNGGQVTTTNSIFDGTADVYFTGRTSSSSGFIRKGSNARITASTTSDGRTTGTMKLGVLDTGGSLGTWHTRKISLFWVGGALSSGQEDTFLDAWNRYIAAISTEPALATLGTIVDQKTWTSLTGYTTNGTTPTLTNNDLVFSGGSGVFTKTLDYNYYTASENWDATVVATVGTKVSNSFGIGVGVRSTNTNNQYDAAFQFDMTTGSNSGKGNMYTGTNGAYTSRGLSPAQSFSAGDSIQVRSVRTYNRLDIYTKNLTTGSSEQTQTFSYTTSPNMPNTSKFAMFNFGGSPTVTSWRITSNEIYGANYAIVGDSKTQQYQASLFNLRYASLLTDHLGLGPVLAGGSDKTADVLNRVNEIIAHAPKAVILAIGSNDPRFGISSATTISNYDAIVSALVGAGIRVVHTTGFYETSGIDQATLRTHIINTYNSADIIDTLPTTLTLNGDGVHPDDSGMVTISNMILSSGKLINAIFKPTDNIRMLLDDRANEMKEAA